MKKSIKAELVSLAHKILQLRDQSDYAHMAQHARDLHEKLTILAYAEKLENQGKPTIGLKTVEEEITLLQREEMTNKMSIKKELALEEPFLKTVKKEIPVTESDSSSRTPAQILADNQAKYAQAKGSDSDQYRPDGMQYNNQEPTHEPVIEKIKDMWPEMSPEAAEMDKVIESIIPKKPRKSTKESFTIDKEFAQTPVFEPKSTDTVVIEDRPKNLNDKLKGGAYKIGLNDKISFIKHLFNGSSKDYNRVMSQLETLPSESEAKGFIIEMVKPDYENWIGKEAQEERFMEVVLGRYN